MEAQRPLRPNRLLLISGVFFYLALTILIGGGVLWLTLWAYAEAGETISETVSAAVLNTTAATLLWLAFFGGLDMFLTLWTIMQTRQMESERQRREERKGEEDRKEREAERTLREAERAAREQQTTC